MRDTYTPKKIFGPIGMAGDRFRYVVKLGLIQPTGRTRAGSPNKYTATEAAKAALINWCDHIGMDLNTAEAIIAFAFRPEILRLVTQDGPDYYTMSQGHTVFALLPNETQAGNRPCPAGTYAVTPMDGVILYAPAAINVCNGGTVTYINLSMLLRFFAERIGFTLNDLG